MPPSKNQREWTPQTAKTGEAASRFSPKAFVYECWRSLMRHRLDNTGLTKSKIIFSNFFLHIQPVKVHRRSLKLTRPVAWG